MFVEQTCFCTLVVGMFVTLAGSTLISIHPPPVILPIFVTQSDWQMVARGIFIVNMCWNTWTMMMPNRSYANVTVFLKDRVL